MPYADRIRAETIQWVTERVNESWKTRRVTWKKPGVRILPPYVQGESESVRGMRYYVGDDHELSAVMTLYFAGPDNIRLNQFACRFGGEEFIWVLEGVRWDETIMQILPRWVKKSPLNSYGLSVTMGIVELPAESQNFTESYRLADERLYQGKRSGKIAW